MPEGLALTVFLVLLMTSIVSATLAQYYYDKLKRAQDAIAYMIEEEVDE